jgi:hypothetical protein
MAGGGSPPENDRIPAGYTFLGQFLIHDISFDATSIFEQQRDPQAEWNFRTPALELDSVYGGGPRVTPHLYSREDPDKLLLGPDGHDVSACDVPRNQQGTALIGDPRNDENLILSQLHFAFLRFHNRVVDLVRDARAVPPGDVFRQAQAIVRRHYQWIVLHEYLPLVCSEAVVIRVLGGARRFYRWAIEPFIPVEFSAAAFRFGHAQVRSAYRVNDDFEAPLLTNRPYPGGDLRGGRTVSRQLSVDWSYFFRIDRLVAPQRSLRIDTRIADGLFELPAWVVPGEANPARRSLPYRTLQRGVDLGLPSGQDVARLMEGCVGEQPLTPAETWEGTPFADEPAPLWYYVLREAEKRRHGGVCLGAVGARIVAEVIVGLLEADPESILNVDGWRPGLPARRSGTFTIADLLEFAGVA